ncbi:tyrosine-type recombinase/integrase [Duganella sp. BuS-21]|uniref:tyrosine-type recombinase/integrase n=1 Tax=Duganella sp. BuS-21 TaxID=2943848 RepID=UPI0035A5C4CE
MAKENLTILRVQEFTCPPEQSQAFLWDTKSPGLALRASRSGTKTYIFQAKIRGAGIDPRITIGSPDTWKLPDAREQARLYKLMTDKGQDPREVEATKRTLEASAKAEQARTVTRESVTLGDVWPTYLADRKPMWSDGHYNNHVNLSAEGGKDKKRGKGKTVTGPLYALMDVRLADLTSDRIADWMTKEAETRATSAAQSFRILRAFIRWADDVEVYRDIIPKGAYTARKVRDATPSPEAKHGDSLQREQLQAWFAGVLGLNNKTRSVYLQALLLTGARRTELTELRWENVDFEWNKMLIGDKVEGNREIPLPPYLSILLYNLPRINEWVFASTQSESGHIEEPKDAHGKALKAAGLPHLTIHGLRRSFGTLTEWLHVPVGVVAQINGHKPSALAEKHYKRRPIDMLRYWHVKIEHWILEEARVAWKPSN